LHSNPFQKASLEDLLETWPNLKWSSD